MKYLPEKSTQVLCYRCAYCSIIRIYMLKVLQSLLNSFSSKWTISDLGAFRIRLFSYAFNYHVVFVVMMLEKKIYTISLYLIVLLVVEMHCSSSSDNYRADLNTVALCKWLLVFVYICTPLSFYNFFHYSWVNFCYNNAYATFLAPHFVNQALILFIQEVHFLVRSKTLSNCRVFSLIVKALLIRLVVATRPFSRDGDMAENHEAPETGQLFRAWTRGRRKSERCQRASGAKSP